jgi:HEAT repeat protein
MRRVALTDAPRPALVLGVLAAALLVGACRSEPKPPDPSALVEKLKSPDSAVSGSASLELIRLGEPAVPALMELLRDPDPAHRALAARTFWGMGAKAGAAAGALGEALADPEAPVRVGAAMALDNMGPPAAPAVEALARALRDPSLEVRQWAARALGSIGPAAAPAVDALERAARHEGVRASAEESIRKIRAR